MSSLSNGIMIEKLNESAKIAHVIKMSQREARKCGPGSSSTIMDGHNPP